MADELKYDAKLFSMFGMNGAVFGKALLHYQEEYKFKVLTADMSSGAGLSKFALQYPDDLINVGIAEQNLIGVSAGLASEGYDCITVAQACFLSMRAFEQIRQFLGYMRNKCILVGINSGFALTFFGNSHYAIEDIALMRSIPGMTVLSPADAGEAVKAFEAAISLEGPVYIRLSGTTNLPIVYPDDYSFEIGKAIKVFDSGKEISLFSTGTMVNECMLAAKELESDGIMCRVFDVHTIKPLDKETVLACKDSKLIVTVEEHNVIGGLGSAVSEIVAENGNMPKMLRIGIPDQFSNVGDYQYLRSQNDLTATSIKQKCINAIQF